MSSDEIENFDFEKVLEEYLLDTRGVKASVGRIGRYYPSAIGFCMRKQYLDRFLEYDFDLSTLKVFFGGDVFQDNVVDEVLRWKYQHSKRVKHVVERSLTIVLENGDHDVIISGRADELLVLEDGREIIPIEVKSVGNGIRYKKEPSESHVFQLVFYMMAYDSPYGYLVYGERAFDPKKNADKIVTKTFKVTKEQKKKYWQILKKRVIELDNYLRNGIVPPAEATKTASKSWMCKYCPHVGTCVFLSDTGEIEIDYGKIKKTQEAFRGYEREINSSRQKEGQQRLNEYEVARKFERGNEAESSHKRATTRHSSG